MSTNRQLFMAIVLFFVSYSFIIASPFPFFKYSFFIENEEYMLLHYWSIGGVRLDYLHSDNPFIDKNNNYAYFLLIRKKDGTLVLKQKSSLFTYGWIDPKSNYIVLLSVIDRFRGAPHVALFSVKGDLIFKSRICPYESVLNLKEYNSFRKRFPEYNELLLKSDAISMSNDKKTIYINICNTFYRDIENDDIAMKHLDKWLRKSHYSNSFNAMTNGILLWFYHKLFWYTSKNTVPLINEPNPKIGLIQSKSGKVLGIFLNDPMGKQFTIPITRKDDKGILVCVDETDG